MFQKIIMIGIIVLFMGKAFAVEDPVHITYEVEQKESEVTIDLTLSINPPWHINSHEPNNNFLIPTEINFSECKLLDIHSTNYPEPIIKKLKTFSKELSLYSGKININIKGRTKSFEKDLPCIMTISYQACNDVACLKPATQKIDLRDKLIISTANTEITSENTYNEKFKNLFLGGNYILAFLLLFIVGLLLNLTPCVYPMVPITLGFFIGQTDRYSRLLLLGSAYALGICITYSLLGFFAALTGNMFGMLLQNKIVLILMATFIIALALSMFGFYEIRIPQKLLPKEGKKGIFGSLLMGASLGLVAAPCIGPFILGLLTFVSNLGSKALGFLIFFVLSLGLAVPYVFLAVFSGSLRKLPKSGAWLIWVKRLLGVILIAFAIYILQPFFNFDTREGKIDWIPYKAGIIEKLQTEGKPILVDFYASWCFPCHIMDRTTFQDDRVVAELTRFSRIKVDLTFEDSETQDLSEKYKIRGVPTYLFFDSHGNFLEDKTASGAFPPDEFLRILQNIP